MVASGHMTGWIYDWNSGLWALLDHTAFPGAAAAWWVWAVVIAVSDCLAKAEGGIWLSSLSLPLSGRIVRCQGEGKKLRDLLAQTASLTDEETEA